jgi:hypothetical protein
MRSVPEPRIQPPVGGRTFREGVRSISEGSGKPGEVIPSARAVTARRGRLGRLSGGVVGAERRPVSASIGPYRDWCSGAYGMRPVRHNWGSRPPQLLVGAECSLVHGVLLRRSGVVFLTRRTRWTFALA